MVVDLEDSLLFQAKEIHNSPHAKAELSRGHCVEGIAGLIHPPHGAPARMRRNGECFELSQRGVNGRWKVIALCGEGASLSLQDVCLPHSQPTATVLAIMMACAHFQMAPKGHYYLG